MDPNDGVTPSAPRLDSSPGQPQQPLQPEFTQQPPPPSIPDSAPSMPPTMSSSPLDDVSFASPDSTAAPIVDINSPGMPLTTPPVDDDPLNRPPRPAPLESSWQQPIPEALPEDQLVAPKKQRPSMGGSKKILIIVVGSILVAGLIAGAGLLGYTSGKSAGRKTALAEFQQQQLEQQQETPPPVDPAAEVKLDLATLKDPTYKDEVVKGETGKQVETSDGFVLYVTSIDRNFRVEDPNYQLDTNKELVKVNFVMGNVTKDKAKDLTSSSPPFTLEDAEGAKLTPENIANYEGKFDSVKIEPGNQAKGSIVFAVKKGAKPLTFVREQRYRLSNQNREVTTRMEIIVAPK